MTSISGVSHARAIRALEKIGYRIYRQSKHIIMTNGIRVLVIPRANPVNSHTLGKIVRSAGLTPAEFRKLL